MGNKRDLTNNLFGKLLALNEIPKRVNGSVVWLCRCACGVEKEVTQLNLVKGNTKSCGCLKKENAKKVGLNNKKNKGESGFNQIFSGYKWRAKKKGIEFNLSDELFRVLTSVPCYYCNRPPVQVSSEQRRSNLAKEHSRYFYNGLDRVNPKLGYVVGNVVPCCSVCNYAKRILGIVEFKNWINSVYKNLNGA